MKKLCTLLLGLGLISGVAMADEHDMSTMENMDHGHMDMGMMHHSVTFTGKETLAKDVQVSHCWIRLIPGQDAMSAAYFDLKNDSDKKVQLQAVQIQGFGSVMLHQSKTENGQASMEMVHYVNVPAHKEIQFAPGGYHLMLGAKEDSVKEGQKLAAQFKLGDQKAQAECLVEAPTALKYEN